MGRTRSFDEDKVLWNAMNAFRRHGYAGVSIKQLEQATGLTSGSLYHAYGDKVGLFQAVLSFYVDGFVAKRLDAHAGAGAMLDDLEELFLSLLKEPLTDGYGCLVTNSAIEFGSGPSIASDGIGRALDLVASGLRTVLEREIGLGRAKVEASHLMLLYQGMLVLSRAGRIDEGIESVVRAEFDRLREIRRGQAGMAAKGSQQQED